MGLVLVIRSLTKVNNMDWIFDKQGFRIGIDDMGNLVLNVDPNEIPLDAPGIIVWNGSFEIKGFPSLGVNIGEFNLGGEFTLQDQIKDLYFHGDSLLQLEVPMKAKLKKNNTEFEIEILPNTKKRAGKLRISCSNIEWSYEEINKYIFEIANEVLNNISIQYCIPIGFTYFAIIHHNMKLFSVVESKPKTVKFTGVMLEPKSDWDLWHLASGNYRKAWLSSNPIERFLNLYLAIEGARSSIKKQLDLPYEKNGKIIHSLYKEPVLDKDFSINTQSRFSQLVGMEFYNIIFTSSYGFRELRNKAAHAVQENSGVFILNTNLGSYLDYQSAIQYLNYIYIQYTNVLVQLSVVIS